ncbi:ROK family protein [Pseudotabrizicola sp. L79]|uniref:ROK family protein n=1 Tax=Pseudotabrizicola sp. L79 TaxID=3118402 RepID=UPI002F94998A
MSSLEGWTLGWGIDVILCFDIGGSRIKAGLADTAGLRALGEVATPVADFGAFVAALRGFAQGHDLRGVAISIAGVVAPETGRIKVANIPCADGRVLAHEVQQALGLPCLVLNDADCFALAEARQGAGRGHGTVFGIILGTGVGGGLVMAGRLVQGAGGYAGEWGHGPILPPPFDFPCGCGLRGCVDAVCGARGLEALHRALGQPEAGSVEILAGWRAKEPGAVATVDRWLALIAPVLAVVVNVVGASVLPAGGGLANDHALLAALDGRVRQMILRASAAPLVVPALCQPEPGLIGAAEAGLEAFG